MRSIVQGKEAQIQAIRNSPEYIGRERIDKGVAVKCTGLKPADAQNLLSEMAKMGYLNERTGHGGCKIFTVPYAAAARVKWRRYSNKAVTGEWSNVHAR
jgi:hypothetical protein